MNKEDKPLKIKAKCPECKRRLWRKPSGETACLTHGYTRPKAHKTAKGTVTTAPRQRKRTEDEKKAR